MNNQSTTIRTIQPVRFDSQSSVSDDLETGEHQKWSMQDLELIRIPSVHLKLFKIDLPNLEGDDVAEDRGVDLDDVLEPAAKGDSNWIMVEESALGIQGIDFGIEEEWVDDLLGGGWKDHAAGDRHSGNDDVVSQCLDAALGADF